MKKEDKVRPAGHIVDYNLKEELEHGIYVSHLVRDLAEEMKMPKKTQHDVALAGLLHDIGKLELTEEEEPEGKKTLMIEEMKYVRMHADLSYEILKEHQYPASILEAVRHHHENYDGTGYPDNLHGSEIPLGARMIRVCDVFAALTSDRPYRPHFEMEEAMQLMIEEINHFDLSIFLPFQRIVHRVGISYHIHFNDKGEIDGTD